MTGPVTKSCVILLLGCFLILAAEDGRAAKRSVARTCMSSLLQSYNISPRHALVYTRRMSAKKFDELTIRMYSHMNVLLQFQLKAFGIKGSDLARVMACAHSGTGAKSRQCKTPPCGANGMCTFSQQSRHKYVCECKAGYSGKRCEIDLCSPNPCHQNAKCYHTASGFYCSCSKGYTGKTCGKSVNECASSPCQNGGTCEDGALKYRCKCPLGYEGVNCQKGWLNKKKYENQSVALKRQEDENKKQQAEIKAQQAEIKALQAEVKSLKSEAKKHDVCTQVNGVISWRQRSVNFGRNTDNGQLLSMTFKKKRSDTHLRLTWSSDMRQHRHNWCSQWYFTIDGHQCSIPAPVNGNVFTHIGSGHVDYSHRHGSIIGVCRGTSAGNILSGTHQIAMNVRNCPGYRGDAYTGWKSTTTMIVEELCPPQ